MPRVQNLSWGLEFISNILVINYFFFKNCVTSEGAVSENVLYYQPLPITRHQVRFFANNYFEYLPIVSTAFKGKYTFGFLELFDCYTQINSRFIKTNLWKCFWDVAEYLEWSHPRRKNNPQLE